MSRTLLEYASESKRSLYEIAKAAGVDSGDIYAIAEGKKGVRPETAAKIRIATDGQVTEFDLLRARLAWLQTDEGKAEQAAKAKRRPQKQGVGKKANRRPFRASAGEPVA